MTGIGNLLEKAKAGTPLTAEERSRVVRGIEMADGGDDPYVLLQIAGLSAGPELSSLVERYLFSPRDPMLARIALSVLCDNWAMGARYRNEIVAFMEGVEWDSDEEVRTVAISTAGEYLRGNKDSEIGQRLVRLVNDPGEPVSTREWAMRALGRAVGLSHENLPGLGVAKGDPLETSILSMAEALYFKRT